MGAIEQLLKTYKSEKNPTKWKNIVCDRRDVMNPVIRAVDATSGMKCLISFSNGYFVETGERLKKFIEAVPMSKSQPPSVSQRQI